MWHSWSADLHKLYLLVFLHNSWCNWHMTGWDVTIGINVFTKILRLWMLTARNLNVSAATHNITILMAHYGCLSARPSSNPTQVWPKSLTSKWKLICNTGNHLGSSAFSGNKILITRSHFSFIIYICESWRLSGDVRVDARAWAHQRDARNVCHLACMSSDLLLSCRWHSHKMTQSNASHKIALHLFLSTTSWSGELYHVTKNDSYIQEHTTSVALFDLQ